MYNNEPLEIVESLTTLALKLFQVIDRMNVLFTT